MTISSSNLIHLVNGGDRLDPLLPNPESSVSASLDAVLFSNRPMLLIDAVDAVFERSALEVKVVARGNVCGWRRKFVRETKSEGEMKVSGDFVREYNVAKKRVIPERDVRKVGMYFSPSL